MRNILTEQEKQVIKLIADGRDRTEAISEVYKPKNRNCAYVMSNRFFKKEAVKFALSELNNNLNNQIVGKTIKMIQAIDKYLPIDERGKILTDIAKSDDKRSVLQAMDMIIKLGEGYSATKSINLNTDIYQEIELGKEEFDESPIKKDIEVAPIKKEKITEED